MTVVDGEWWNKWELASGVQTGDNWGFLGFSGIFQLLGILDPVYRFRQYSALLVPGCSG
jgi:hypothetical protein